MFFGVASAALFVCVCAVFYMHLCGATKVFCKNNCFVAVDSAAALMYNTLVTLLH